MSLLHRSRTVRPGQRGRVLQGSTCLLVWINSSSCGDTLRHPRRAQESHRAPCGTHWPRPQQVGLRVQTRVPDQAVAGFSENCRNSRAQEASADGDLGPDVPGPDVGPCRRPPAHLGSVPSFLLTNFILFFAAVSMALFLVWFFTTKQSLNQLAAALDLMIFQSCLACAERHIKRAK